jgi:MFS family permease
LKDVRGFTDKATFSLLAGLPLGLSVAADLFGGITADRLARKHGLRKGRFLVGFGSLMSAGVLLIAGVWAPNPYLSAVLIGMSGGMIAFLLGGAWATVLDIGGNHAGLVGAAMNTSGQVGAFLCPLMVGYMVQWFGDWTAPLYFTGLLYCLGALCWFIVDPAKPVWAR